jgi:hypothetical protein
VQRIWDFNIQTLEAERGEPRRYRRDMGMGGGVEIVLSSSVRNETEAGGMARVVEHLPSKSEAPSSNSSTAKKKSLETGM